ncbi:unnamed protein product [Urochloa humidicola]
MAGSFSRTLWPRSAGSATRADCATVGGATPRRYAAPPSGETAAWRSPTVDQRLANHSAPPPTPACSQLSSSPPRHGRGVPPAVRFTTPPSLLTAYTTPIHRAWRTATPYRHTHVPTASAPTVPADDITEVHMPYVDMEPSRRLAYAFVEPACTDPGFFIRIALEQRGGDPPVRLAPSSYGTMMVVFGHSYFRETTIRRGPLTLDGYTLRLERHEEADFRVLCPYTRLVELAATSFPPEHWHEHGIRRAFQAFGQVCSVAKSCLHEVDVSCRHHGVADYSVVRVLVLIDERMRIMKGLVVCNPNGEISGITNVRVVGEWPHQPSAPPPENHTFSDGSSGDSPPPDSTTPRRGRPGLFQSPGSRHPPPRFNAAGSATPGGGGCRTLGSMLYPSVPLWTFMSGACTALARALSLTGVPRITIRDIPTPTRPATPPPPAAPPVLFSDSDEISACLLPRSVLPSLSDLIAEEEHEVSIRKKRVCRKRAADSASKQHRSRRLAAKEIPFYEDATTKATRVKAAQLDMSKASKCMKKAIDASEILSRPAPKKIAPKKPRCLDRVCGLVHLSEVEDEEPIVV